MPNIPGYIFQYKDENGNWIRIPALINSIYTAYCNYCEEHSLTPVPETTYYNTIGNLQSLVEQLGSSEEALLAIAAALGEGALPTAMGGTGLIISPDEYVYLLSTSEPDDWATTYTTYYKFIDGVYVPNDDSIWAEDTFYLRKEPDYQGTFVQFLTDTVANGGLDLTTKTYVDTQISSVQTTVNTALDAKANTSDFSAGTDNPVDGVTQGTYYFQYKD